MLKRYFESAGANIQYGDAAILFPADELDATVYQHRDAQHALTAIPVDSLPTAVRTQIAEKLDALLDTFDFIQISKWNSDSQNNSLAKFTHA